MDSAGEMDSDDEDYGNDDDTPYGGPSTYQPWVMPPSPPRKSKVVTLSVSSEMLAKFPAGEWDVKRPVTPQRPTRIGHAFSGQYEGQPEVSKVAGAFGGSFEPRNSLYVKLPNHNP